LTSGGLRSRVQAYLAAHHVMTLATHGGDGPWAAAVFYVHEGWTLYFLSAPTSRHSRNIMQNPHVAATIQEDYEEWEEIKGIQLEGAAARLSGAQEERVRGLYAAKFPLLRDPPAAIAQAMSRIGWYRVAPERAWFVDNSVAFGHRDEVDLS
jgi:uncharacterized protein YhbP (UPF0306 family)